MAKYYIKQRFVSFRGSMDIYDESGEAVFFVKGSLVAIPRQLKIFDKKTNEEMISVKHKMIDIMPQFFVVKNKEKIARVKKKFSFHARFDIQSDLGEYSIDGDIFAWNYTVIKDGKAIAYVSKKIISLRDVYELDIIEESETSMVLALAVIFDECMHSNRNK